MHIPTVTADQMREVDRLMEETYGISLLQMMELAGRNLADLARAQLNGSVVERSIIVAAGRGNNGGGGLVAARHLVNWGAAVTILVESAQELSRAPRAQWESLKHLPLGWHEGEPARRFLHQARADLIIDALIGYGLRGDPRGWVAGMIDQINALARSVLALDVPSGLDATTGRPGTPCINASTTMTLALPKAGLLQAEARPFVGNLYLADIGVPSELYSRLGLNVGPIFRRCSVISLDTEISEIGDGD